MKEELDSIEKPYDPKAIDIRQKTIALYNIIKRLREGEIDLHPDFQRNANLWEAAKQSRLIESILIRIPLPVFYFDGVNDNKWQVIDGLQRLCAINNFVVAGTLRLTGLEYLKQFENSLFVELPRIYQRQIEEAEIITYIMTSETPDVKYNIFKRINTGGITLNPQEIRNALNQGVPADFIKELANSDAFGKATDWRIKPRRMADREYVTRFITFYLNKPDDYRPALDPFMSNAMSSLNHLSPEEREVIKRNFISAMDLAKTIFGRRAFRKVFDKNNQKLNPINKALFEVWSVALAKLSDAERQMIQDQKETIFDDAVQLMRTDPSFVDAITSQTANKNKVVERFSKVDQLLRKRLS
ncbi:MAG: DUF262 domain-containing protein [Kiritimatiellaeota bacterium]|nr:DUF262 domain-containing protein [Kiritimatiellota bacterium]